MTSFRKVTLVLSSILARESMEDLILSEYSSHATFDLHGLGVAKQCVQDYAPGQQTL
jgi:hypothetical protein